MNKEEKIVCSAIKITKVNDVYNGIYLGLRHGDCFGAIARIRELVGDSDEWRVKCLQNAEQGFLTSKNRFVDREKAMIIAQNNNQVIRKYDDNKELYSECIY